MEIPFKTVIVDDEIHAINAMKSLLGEFREISIEKTFTCPNEAFGYTLQNKPDLIFLDIQMPLLSGIQFAQKLIERNLNIPVIFTTAHDNFILEAFRNDAIDYLLKPVSLPELKDAIEHFKRKNGNEINQTLKKFLETNQRIKIHFNSRNGFITFFEDEIIFVKADGAYSNIRLKNDREITVSQNMGKVEEQIHSSDFIKIHRSVIVNSQFIFEINRGKKECTISVDSKLMKLPVSAEGMKLLTSLITG
jgi:two-component system, LytTR family, response regulator